MRGANALRSAFDTRLRRKSAAVIGIALALLAAGCGGSGEGSDLNGMTRNPPTEVGAVQLPQTNPERARQGRALTGSEQGLMLVYFGYTHCPDVCPTTLADLRVALADLDPGRRSMVEVGMVTVDPERDTTSVLNGYLGHFFDAGAFAAFVPANAAQLQRAEAAFGTSHRLGRPDQDGRYDVEHSAQVFAVDSEGTVLVEWPFGEPSQNMTADLRRLLDRQTSSL